MGQRVLDEAMQAELAHGRALLAELRDALSRYGSTPDDEQVLSTSIRQLDEIFLIVVVGEFNAGKSAFINALVGEQLLQEGVTPTTAMIHVLKYGPAPTTSDTPHAVRVVTAPAEMLRDVHIVDTPGTNAVLREHEQLTREFVPRSDFVLFVTSADRPFTETERAFLDAIRAWGKKTVVVINKVDIFDQPADAAEVIAFVRRAAEPLLGVTPPVFAVSARLAMRAKQGQPELWAASGFGALETFLRESLDERSRFNMKLANPLGVGEALARRYATMARDRIELLRHDLDLLATLERQLAVYRDDLARGFELRMRAAEQPLLEMEQRAQQYFEDTIRLGRVVDLLNRARVQSDFEAKVVGDVPRTIERRVTELIDWLIDQDYRQWEAVTDRVRQRRHGHHGGAPEIGSFHADRAALIDSVGREAQRVIDTYDRQREAAAIADQARSAVAAAAAVGGAAVGVGTLVTVIATTAAADVTGILMAGLLAALGFLVIPARRKRARTAMQEKMAELRARLAQTLRTEFERAVQQSTGRIDAAIAPYSRFVRAEDQRWRDAAQTLAHLEVEAATVRARLLETTERRSA